MERRIIEWDDEKCNRLYDFLSEKTVSYEQFFSYQLGRAIVNFVMHYKKDIEGTKVLDYGCGPGFIVDRFLEKNADVYGVDMSPETVRSLNERIKDNPHFRGCEIFDGSELPFPDDTFDVITVTEVVEHLLPHHIDIVLSELKRVLKPDGIMLMTTPNEEDFSIDTVCCPECNTVFHKWGHVNRFDVESLKELMESHGWKTVECNVTNFWEFQKNGDKFSVWDLSIRKIYGYMRILAYHIKTTKEQRFRDKIGTGQNLFYIGSKGF